MDLEDTLGQFHWEDPDPRLRERIVQAARKPAVAPRSWRRAGLLAAAATIVVALGAGVAIWAIANRDAGTLVDAAPSVEILGGRGRVTAVAADARFTVVDAERGRVRLERGEVLVELENGAAGDAEVETPAGTARARATCFYAHYSGAEASLLAVAVVQGKVEMATPHGQATCLPGDVAFARPGAAPHKHPGPSKHPSTHHRGFCPFVSTLGLVYRSEVQAELRLTEAQRLQLQRPDTDERREICKFFQSLRGIAPDEWARQTNAFCDDLERKLGRVLTAEQHTRLRQIAHQQEGYFALLRPELARDFGLQNEQKDGIEKLLRDFAEARRGLLDRKLPRPEWDRQIHAAWRESLASAERLLTPEQRARWQALIGPPLHLPMEF